MPSNIQRGFVKVCGVTTVADATFIATTPTSAIGLNFVDESPRHISKERAREIVDATNGSLLRCAVFRNDDEFMFEQLEGLGVEMVQVHGVLSERALEHFRDRSLLVVKALNIEGTEFDDFDDASVDAVLIDGPRPGSGVAHSWARLSERHFAVPVIAAGGLNAENVKDVVASTTVDGVDAASGVERAPGIKDEGRVTGFVTNAREAFEARGVA